MFKAIITATDNSTSEIPVLQTGNTLAIPAIPADVKHVELHMDDFTARAGEDGYFLLPTVPARNRPAALVRFKHHEDQEDFFRISDLPVFGVKHGDRAILAVVSGMSIDFNIVCGVENDEYYLRPRFTLNGQLPYETPEVKLFELTGKDADYCGMARRYRQYQLDRGACVPLAQRTKDFPVLAEEAKSLEVRIRHAWKQVPPPVDEQTPETEGPLTVAVTFQRACDILDKCHEKGIKHAEFCLVGWNKSGHDGRFPDLFPVEPQLGGEPELKKLIQKARDYGYFITCHTNCLDAYTISSRLDRNDFILKQDGTVAKGGRWGGGQSYQLCPKMAHEHYVVEDMDKLAELGFYGQHYIDVASIIEPVACHHPDHPLTPREAGQWRCKSLALAREKMGASASEGNLDFCVHDLDYVLYAMFDQNPKGTGLTDEVVPFWFIVYHGILLYNVSCQTLNYMIKDDPTLKLKNIEYGGRPSAYFHAQFLSTGTHWMGAQDLRCSTDEELDFGTTKLAEAEREHQTLADLQFVFMDDYRMLTPDASVTTYSNGTEIVVNYGDTPVVHRNATVQPISYMRFD